MPVQRGIQREATVVTRGMRVRENGVLCQSYVERETLGTRVWISPEDEEKVEKL